MHKGMDKEVTVKLTPENDDVKACIRSAGTPCRVPRLGNPEKNADDSLGNTGKAVNRDETHQL
jgi:hypothetical protein